MSIHVLDTLQLGRPGIIAATALQTSEGVALFDTGPEATFTNVLTALGSRGFTPKDVRHVFLSHIHFDHAGAAFRFAELGAIVYVHSRGESHLLDPTRLVESAKRIFGNQMETLWGRIAPVPREKLRVVGDGEIVRVGEFEVKAVATPGHASHHHVYYWDGTVFGGDIAGVRLGSGPPIPPFVPPELNVQAWLESLEKIRALNPEKIYLPHFGAVAGSLSDHLDSLSRRVKGWWDWFHDKFRQGMAEQEELITQFAQYEHEELRNGGATEKEIEDYETADPSYMAVPAAVRYWKKSQAEPVAG